MFKPKAYTVYALYYNTVQHQCRVVSRVIVLFLSVQLKIKYPVPVCGPMEVFTVCTLVCKCLWYYLLARQLPVPVSYFHVSCGSYNVLTIHNFKCKMGSKLQAIKSALT